MLTDDQKDSEGLDICYLFYISLQMYVVGILLNFFCPCLAACGIFIPQSGVERVLPSSGNMKKFFFN